VSALIASCQQHSAGLAGPDSLPLPGGGESIFSDDFESGTLEAWQDGVDPARHRIVTDSTAQSGGSYLVATYPAGRDGGWLTRFFMPGYDSLYVSYYVRFPADWQGGTKLVGLYGSRIDDQWSGMGKAGICPSGTDFFSAMLITEATGNPGPPRFYTYYPAMAREPDGKTCWGRYGNGTGSEHSSPALYASSPTLGDGMWHHIEFWVQLNTPARADGRQVFWIDGTQRASWSDLSFRSSTVLRLNAVQLSFNSGADGVARTQELSVDNLVVRTAPP
jgi:Polysaccharide lyase 14